MKSNIRSLEPLPVSFKVCFNINDLVNNFPNWPVISGSTLGPFTKRPIVTAPRKVFGVALIAVEQYTGIVERQQSN